LSFQGRKPDKPGTYRIRPAKAGGMRLSGVRSDGKRVRMGGLSESEARELAARLFPAAVATPPVVRQATWDKTDDWGLPVTVSDDTVASVARTLNLPDPNAPIPVPTVAKEETADEREKKERRAKNAKSLMDLAGIAGSAGVVMVSRKITEGAGKEPVKVDPKQVGDLRDSIRETLTEWFGEKEVAPWQMMILLALGIPMSMLLQSPRKKVEPVEAKPELKSVR
jgi:hypothetical protein